VSKLDLPDVSVRLHSDGLYRARYRPAGSEHVFVNIVDSLQGAVDWLNYVMSRR
jgi:hypothetical protein